LASIALLRIDPLSGAELDARLKALPFVAEVSRRAHSLERFEQQSANMIRTVSAIIALFAATITVGVVYNNARIALATRARDLASLRVLGFTRGEISSILLGELALEVLVALPFGFVFGGWLVAALASTVDPETYRLPIVLTVRSYAFAATVTLLAALFSALVVRRRIDQLDLVGVLKTKE
jgi:putative ABC transport system permease protein